VLRTNTAPVVAIVDLHQGVERDAIRRGGLAQRPGAFDRADKRRDSETMGEVGQPTELPSPDDRVGDRDVRQPRVGHHLGLAELLTGDPHRTRLHLQDRELGDLVALDVGPKRDLAISTEPRHRLDVRSHPVEIDDQGRGIDVVQIRPRLHDRRPRSPSGHGIL